MQKKIIALAIAAAFAAPTAVMAAAHGAAAGVTVYGSVDAGVRQQSQDTSATAGRSEIAFASGTYNSNRFGIKASDDLGDGMKANVVLEGSLNIGTGAAGGATLFDRQATVGVSSSWGRIDAGRQNAINFKTAIALNAFGPTYAALAYNTMASNGTTRRDATVAYTGTFGDVTVSAEHSFDNAVVSNTATAAGATNTTTMATTGAAQAVGVSYKLGDLVIAGSHTTVDANPAPNTADTGDSTNIIFGANYTFGDIKVFVATASTDTEAVTSDAESKLNSVGVTYKMSDKVGLTAAYYMGENTAANGTVKNTSDRMMVGATYGLSKATKLYAGVDTQTNNTGVAAAPDLKTTGMSLGLATAF